ncbi:MAG TPA: molybdate ABC transporter substrate-binding protein [Stellaceae bacterium]|jgi:molybdate transport system substrate-binding protein|nr:molybdate ABC transporter substrate-binding protein [Stellaceae bacterium]
MRKPWLIALCLALQIALAATASAKDAVVFAAASLKNALDEASASYQQEAATGVLIAYAASSTLAKQIENGAPADLFISADLDWMDYLQQRNLIKAETRVTLLGNRLVLIAPAESTATVEIRPGFPLADMLGDQRLAMGDPGAVPAGKYGKAALEKLGIWPSVAAKVAPAEDVRAALLLVERRETPLGIVYATDAAADKGVRIVASFPKDSHPPILYPAAEVASGGNPAAAAFLAYLKSERARPFFERQGFTFRP